MTPPAWRRRDTAFCVGLSMLLLAAVAGPQLRRVYPFTYDELVYLRKTRAYDAWLRQGWSEARAGRPGWLFSRQAIDRAEALADMHPGFVKLAAVVPHRLGLLVLHREGGARLTGALFLALAAITLYALLLPETGRLPAAFAAVGLATLPRLFGHAHLFALDVPIGAMSLLAAALLRRAALRDRWPAVALAGLLTGLAFATKLNAAALLPHLALWCWLTRPPGRWKLLAAGLLVPPVVLACWPWLWPAPVARLAELAAFHGHHFRVGTTWFGQLYGGDTTPPAAYPPVMLALSTPLPWTLFGSVGLLFAARRRRSELSAFLAAGLLANLALPMLPGAARYGGVRLFLAALPYLVGLSAVLLAGAAPALPSLSRAGRVVRVALFGAICLPNLSGIRHYYPWLLSYYAEPAGLPAAARAGLEVTYWGDAYAAAREFVNRPEHASATFYAAHELATGVLDAYLAAGEIPPQHRFFGRYVTDRLPPEADYILVDNHPPLWPPAVAELVRTGTPVATYPCRGVPLLWVFRGPANEGQETVAGQANTGAVTGPP